MELEVLLRSYAQRTLDASVTERMVYSDPSLWEKRFQSDDSTFDWYTTFQELGDIFREFSPPAAASRALVVGCGNSLLSSEMAEAGYRNITNIDISAAAIWKMKERDRGENQATWLVMDATAMTFPDSSFDLAVDKGTLDAMMHGKAHGSSVEASSAMIAEVWRTLRAGGVFILVSHNGHRFDVLNEAVSPSRWQEVEVRRCQLSAQATLINVLRAKFPGQPLAIVLKDPELLREAVAEAKEARRRMAFLEVFRLFKARKAKEKLSSGEQDRQNACEDELEDDAETSQNRLQPYCWVYVLQKPETEKRAIS